MQQTLLGDRIFGRLHSSRIMCSTMYLLDLHPTTAIRSCPPDQILLAQCVIRFGRNSSYMSAVRYLLRVSSLASAVSSRMHLRSAMSSVRLLSGDVVFETWSNLSIPLIRTMEQVTPLISSARPLLSLNLHPSSEDVVTIKEPCHEVPASSYCLLPGGCHLSSSCRTSMPGSMATTKITSRRHHISHELHLLLDHGNPLHHCCISHEPC